MIKEVLVYRDKKGKEPFAEWLYSLKDKSTRHRIETRIDRLENGNLGTHKRFKGILELILDFGKGYRVFCGEDGNTIVILLIGGDKSTQKKDIQKAVKLWEDYNEE